MSGEIDPFSSVRLDIVFAPCVPGDIQANFRITFAKQESDPVRLVCYWTVVKFCLSLFMR